MFCSNCGAPDVSGNFCARCGAPLGAASATAAPPPAGADREPGPVVDWSQEVSYAALVSIPEVRERVARQAELAPHRMSGEEFLQSADKVVGPLVGSPVGMATVAKLVVPIYTAIGVKTGKTAKQSFGLPVGRVTVAVLCSLGRRGMPLATVHQAADGCLFEAAIKSDFRSWGGKLAVTVERTPEGASVEAGTRIPAQLFDWGKSNAILRDLFADVTELAAPDVVG